jgi:hypothetical protein
MLTATNYQIRLSSRRVNKNQSRIKFSAQNNTKETKGHLLLIGNLSLREVVEIIADKVDKINRHATLSPQDLCCLTSANTNAGYIFFEG